MTMTRWAIIADFPNYEVSNEGSVRRRTSGKGTRAGKILKGSPSNGYPAVLLGNGVGARKSIRVHKLVANAFLPPPPTEYHDEIAHWDNNRLNAHEDNLRWATPEENNADKRRHGTLVFGTAVKIAKLDPEAVLLARELRAAGYSFRSIAERIGVSTMTAHSAVTGRTWAHVRKPQPSTGSLFDEEAAA